MERTEFLPALTRAFSENQLSLSPEEAEQLYLLADHVATTNEAFNLTAITSPQGMALLHMADCAMAARSFPKNARVIDVGCGGGFPSLPLAILRPDLSVTAMDSTAKKVEFVKNTANMLGLSNLQTVVGRAEELARTPAHREQYDVATARAVANLRVLSELCLPFVKVGGHFISMKGRTAAAELEEAKGAIEKLGGTLESFSDAPLVQGEEAFARAELIFRKRSPTPACYPRAFGKIRKAPL